MKKAFKNYGKPTPIKWRKLGDSLLVASMFGMTFASVSNHKYLALVIVCIGIIGKFLTNFFTEDKPESNEKKETIDQ